MLQFYRIYSNKSRGAYLTFRATSLSQMRRLFEGGAKSRERLIQVNTVIARHVPHLMFSVFSSTDLRDGVATKVA